MAIQTLRRKWILLLVAALIGLGLAISLAIFLIQLPPAEAQPPAADIILTITQPTDGSMIPLSTSGIVRVEAVSWTPLTVVELWVDGIRIDSTQVLTPVGAARAQWSWGTSDEGEHYLIARAVDDEGRAEYSNLVRVLVSRQMTPSMPAPDSGGEGQPASLPVIGPFTPTELPTPPSQEPWQGSVVSPRPPSKIQAWAQSTFLPVPLTIPGAPELWGEVAGCNVRLLLRHPQVGETGVTIYRLSGDDAEPQALMTSGAIGPGEIVEYIDEAKAGIVGYFARAFNQAGRTSSEILRISPDRSECGETVGGAPRFILGDGRLLPFRAIDELYIYLKAGDADWQRVPQDPKSYISQSPNGLFDLNPYLESEPIAQPDLAVPYNIEVWGWAGGALVFLGADAASFEPTAGPPQLHAVEGTDLEILTSVQGGAEHYTTLDRIQPGSSMRKLFRLSTNVGEADGFLWQVSSSPLSDRAELDPIGLSAAGRLDADESQFFIDFTDLIAEPDANEGSDRVIGPLEQLEAMADLLAPLQPPEEPTLLALLPNRLPTTFYVRVIPVLNRRPVGRPSNIVRVQYDPLDTSPGVGDARAPYSAQVVSYLPYRPADPAYATCLITRFPTYLCQTKAGSSPSSPWFVAHENLSGTETEAVQGFLGVDQEIDVVTTCSLYGNAGAPICGCPGVDCSQEEDECSINLSDWGTCLKEAGQWVWDTFKDAADWVSETYEDLKQFAVDVIIEYTPVGWACELAEEEAGDLAPEKACETVIRAGVEAGMAAMGLPPSIPNAKELMEDGKDYIVEEAARQMQANGVPCEETCKGFIRDGLDEALERAEQYGASQGDGTSLPAAGSLYEPHPLSISQPMTIWVEVTRALDSASVPDADLDQCAVVLRSLATNMVAGQAVAGELFYPEARSLPVLAPGQSIKIPFVFERAPWQPPDEFVYPGIVGFDPAMGPWSLLYEGAQVEFLIESPYFSTITDEGESFSSACVKREDWPMPVSGD